MLKKARMSEGVKGVKTVKTPSGFPPLEPPSYSYSYTGYRLQVTGYSNLQVTGYGLVAAIVATGYGFNSSGSHTPKRGRRIAATE